MAVGAGSCRAECSGSLEALSNVGHKNILDFF